MIEIVALLSIYYKCAALAADGLLSQQERFACNSTYQAAKRQFVHDVIGPSDRPLTSQQNVLAYQRFKSWEAENSDLVQQLKQQSF